MVVTNDKNNRLYECGDSSLETMPPIEISVKSSVSKNRSVLLKELKHIHVQERDGEAIFCLTRIIGVFEISISTIHPIL